MAIIRFLKGWVQQWREYFRMRRIDQLTGTISESMLQRMKDKIVLKTEIHKYIQQEFKLNPKSQHIPLSVRREIVESVYNKYRDRMYELGVVVNYSLQFAK